MSKQMRISDTAYEEIKRLVDEYDVDRKSIMNTSIVLLKCIIENNTKTIEFIDADGEKVSMPVPLLFKKRK